ncbi:hypothetical protein N7G274_002046 [Stereocaulon virgatum]|uniref:Uncharacterized protein n=1 Tax=Stereocaulon virgatum TaxID=373712 RepID=A0ABR4AKK3_9LECA
MPPRSSTSREIAPSSVFEFIDRAIERTDLTSARMMARHLQSRRNNESNRLRLYLLQGLPPDLVEVFEAYFWINATFFESHIRRRLYQPSFMEIIQCSQDLSQ